MYRRKTSAKRHHQAYADIISETTSFRSKQKSTSEEVLFVWSGIRGSNSLPPPWQGGALPDELIPHLLPTNDIIADNFHLSTSILIFFCNEKFIGNFKAS